MNRSGSSTGTMHAAGPLFRGQNFGGAATARSATQSDFGSGSVVPSQRDLYDVPNMRQKKIGIKRALRDKKLRLS